MDKDFLTSRRLCLDDSDFDLSDEALTFNKSESHENRFSNKQNTLKIKENKRKQEIIGDI